MIFTGYLPSPTFLTLSSALEFYHGRLTFAQRVFCMICGHYGSLFSKQCLFLHRTGIFRIGSQRELKFGIIHTIELLINVRYIIIQQSICIIISFTQTFSDLETMFPVSDKKKSIPPPQKKIKTKKNHNNKKIKNDYLLI